MAGTASDLGKKPYFVMNFTKRQSKYLNLHCSSSFCVCYYKTLVTFGKSTKKCAYLIARKNPGGDEK